MAGNWPGIDLNEWAEDIWAFLTDDRVVRVVVWSLVILGVWFYFSTVDLQPKCIPDGLDGACGPAGEFLDHPDGP